MARDGLGEVGGPADRDSPEAEIEEVLAEGLRDTRFTPAERRRIMERLLPEGDRRSVLRFFIMQVLSVTIAVMGLTADSAAVVIGAMLVAPLMTPIVGFAAATALGLPRRMARSAVQVLMAVVVSIGLAVLLAAWQSNFELGSEILSRTSPDVRDLIVAVAAGAAGAYAVAREDLSASLPGVAVAVALVPPLATVGVVVQAGRMDLAAGAMLLFLANMVAIIITSMVVFFLTGVVPTLRLAARHRVITGVSIALVASFFAVGIPLTTRSVAASRTAQTETEVRTVVDRWLDSKDLEILDMKVQGEEVTLDLAGPDEPPRPYLLARDLVDVLGPDAMVDVRWSQVATGTASAEDNPEQSLTLRERIGPAVQEWLSEQQGGDRYELTGAELSGSSLDLEVVGPEAPIPTEGLTGRLGEILGQPVSVSVRWIPSLDVNSGRLSPEEEVAQITADWIGPRTSVSLVAAHVTDDDVTVDLAAVGDPLGLSRLTEALQDRFPGRDVTTRLTSLEPAPETGTVTGVDVAELG